MTGINETSLEQRDKAPLSGAVALVTGGSRGIGRAIALRFAGLGSSVAVCGRDVKALEAVTAELHALTPDVLAYVADVTRSADVAGWGFSDRRTKKPKRIGIAF